MTTKSSIYFLLALLISTFTVETGFAREKGDEETDQLNKKLRIVNEKGEMDDYKANLTEVLISKNEAKAMAQLNKLLKKYKRSPLEPGLLYRKAELYVRQAKSARFFEFSRKD